MRVTYRGVGLAAFTPNPNIIRRTRSPRVPTVAARKSPVVTTQPLPSESVQRTLRQAIDDVERARKVRQDQRSARRWFRRHSGWRVSVCGWCTIGHPYTDTRGCHTPLIRWR